MRNGTMFSEMKNYVNADFRKAHPIIEFETANGIYKFNVINVKITDTADKKYNEIIFIRRSLFNPFHLLRKSKKRSYFSYGKGGNTIMFKTKAKRY